MSTDAIASVANSDFAGFTSSTIPADADCLGSIPVDVVSSARTVVPAIPRNANPTSTDAAPNLNFLIEKRCFVCATS